MSERPSEIYLRLKTALEQAARGECRKVDMAAVVRCKDCKNGDWYKYADGTMFCYCMEHEHGGFKHNDFCSRGERIEQ